MLTERFSVLNQVNKSYVFLSQEVENTSTTATTEPSSKVKFSVKAVNKYYAKGSIVKDYAIRTQVLARFRTSVRVKRHMPHGATVAPPPGLCGTQTQNQGFQRIFSRAR